ncbi:MAG: response regulator [Polyangiaceae bacterium]|nr:response regulator [Myxococcales bacterium]MCB9590684.1 response regulator [Polyangiaceae bacterium]
MPPHADGQDAIDDAALRFILANLPYAILIHQGGHVVYANGTAAELLECDDPAALIGQPWHRFMVTEDRNAAESNVRGALTEQQGTLARFGPVERRALSAKGNVVPVELHAFTLNWEGNPALLVSASDISSRKSIEGKLREADRMAAVGTLAAGVAHEVNNPLAYIIANLSFAEEKLRHSPDQEEALEAVVEAHQGIQRVRQVVSDLKTFTHDDQKPQSVLVAKVIQATVKIASAQIRHRARLEVTAGRNARVLATETRLSQVLLNLLVNAAQAVPEDREGRIAISSRVEGAEVWLEVSDNGTGIPAELVDRIMDPFFTTKPVGVGTGLGLSVCKNIVESYQGTLEVDSHLGVGTTMRIRLPLHKSGGSVASMKATPRKHGPKRRVMIIDDDPMILRSLKRVLNGHDLTLMSGGSEALAHLAEDQSFDIILCDLMMPGVTGMDVYKQLSQVAPDLARRIVFLSGGAVTPQAQRLLQEAPNRRYEKPLSPAELDEILRSGTT